VANAGGSLLTGPSARPDRSMLGPDIALDRSESYRLLATEDGVIGSQCEMLERSIALPIERMPESHGAFASSRLIHRSSTLKTEPNKI
jgi:hypothetical protein